MKRRPLAERRLIDIDCTGHPGCYTTAEGIGPFGCDVQGSYDVYLDNRAEVLAGPAFFEVTIRPRDNNLSCAAESVLSSNFAQATGFQLSPPSRSPWPRPIRSPIEASYTLTDSDCFNPELPSRPMAYDYRMRYQRDEKPELAEEPVPGQLTVQVIRIRIENENLGRYNEIPISIALCE